MTIEIAKIYDTPWEFDDFISFLNLETDFLKTASEMELIMFIKDKYDHFRRFNAKSE